MKVKCKISCYLGIGSKIGDLEWHWTA